MRMKKIKMCIMLFSMIVFVCCRSGSPEGNSSTVVAGGETFNSFYKAFHQDSLFQISRIQFPLPGINSDDMTVNDSIYFWKKEDWLFQHMVDTTLFIRKLSITDGTAEEDITSKEPGVLIKRRFKNDRGKWYLVLYEDVNL